MVCLNVELVIGVQTSFIEPGSPWGNVYNESFNGEPRDELLNREVFYTLKDAQILRERWRQEYNTVWPHRQSELSTTGTRGMVASGA